MEFTIHEVSSARSLSLGYLLKRGFSPDHSLKNLQPKPLEELFGLYPMP